MSHASPSRSRSTGPSVWSLVSSIGLVIFVPLLLLLLIGVFTGGFGVGTPELVLLNIIWVVGIVWVTVSWLVRRKKSGRPAAA
jgi:hypothetical protein